MSIQNAINNATNSLMTAATIDKVANPEKYEEKKLLKQLDNYNKVQDDFLNNTSNKIMKDLFDSEDYKSLSPEDKLKIGTDTVNDMTSVGQDNIDNTIERLYDINPDKYKNDMNSINDRNVRNLAYDRLKAIKANNEAEEQRRARQEQRDNSLRKLEKGKTRRSNNEVKISENKLALEREKTEQERLRNKSINKTENSKNKRSDNRVQISENSLAAEKEKTIRKSVKKDSDVNATSDV